MKLRPAAAEFEFSVRRCGDFFIEVTPVLVLAIFTLNVFLHGPALDSLLFALAVAVGFVPMPPVFLGALALLVTLYLASAEIAKSVFYKRVRF